MLSAKWLYPGMVGVAALLYFVTAPLMDYPHPDSSYLRARYAQNLMNGEGFTYNPDERVLLTSAPLPILLQAIASGGEVERPPELLTFLLMGLGAAGLLRLLHDKPLWVGVSGVVVWFLAAGLTFGGLELWLAVGALLALDFWVAGRWRWGALIVALMLLVSPFALLFALLLWRDAPRAYRLWFWLPALVWWAGCLAFAGLYFGMEGLRGLTLNPAAGEGFIGVVSALFLLPLAALLWLRSRDTLPGWEIVLFACAYSLWALAFSLTSDVTLLLLAAVILAASALETRGLVPLAAALSLPVFVLVGIAQRPTLPPIPDLTAESVGYRGSHRAAFVWGTQAVHLGGEHNPHLQDLIAQGDEVGLWIAAAPQIALDATPPDSPAIALLNYQQEGEMWRRGVGVGTWSEVQAVNIPFSRDITLVGVAGDRTQVGGGEVVRLRLDWQLSNLRPISPILLILNLLDFQQAAYGFTETAFPIKKWASGRVSTYHVLPVNADAPPGVYRVQVTMDYLAGIVGIHSVYELKIPPMYAEPLTNRPLATFSDGQQGADLMRADTLISQNQIEVGLVWRVSGDFEADYSIFVHLTAPEDVTPLRQADAPPLDGRYPTSVWEAGEVIPDRYTLDTSGLPAGEYVIRVGFFHPERGRISGGEDGAYLIPVSVP